MAFACVLLSAAVLFVAAGPVAQAQKGGAKAILKVMSDYMSRQNTIELTFDSDIEVITRNWRSSSSPIPARRC